VDLVLPDDLPHGALLHFVLARDVRSLALDIRDSAGRLVRAFRSDADSARAHGTRPLPATRGFHRVVWDLRTIGPRQGRTPGRAEPPPSGQGVKMPPGEYLVRLSADGMVQEQPLRVIGNPNVPEISQADYEAQFAMATAVRDTLVAINDAVARLRAMPTAQRASLARAEALLTPQRGPDNPLAPSGLLAQYGALYSSLVGDGGYGAGSAEGAPSAGQVERKAQLDAEWARVRVLLDDATSR
jgi:hypothetical protein